MALFAIIVTSKKACSGVPGHPVMTVEGEKFWVERDHDGWVPATSSRLKSYPKPSASLKTFNTHDEAEAFAKSWTGHPWWCVPKAHEIV